MRLRLVFTSVGLLLLLTIDACVRVVRSSRSLESFGWSGALIALLWLTLAAGQWRTRGGWRIPVIVVSTAWLGIALATFYLSARMFEGSGWKVVFSSALYSWLIGIVVPAVVISVNLRLGAEGRRRP